MSDHQNQPERPRVEPEIIPPDRSRPGADWRQPAWRPQASGDARGTQRIYVTRIGPFGGAMLMLALALLVAVFFLIIAGAVLIWIPLVALLVVVAAVSRFLRR
jgi:hypothetical protein